MNTETQEKQTTTCPICDATPPTFVWTDTHGVAQCFDCGCPFRLMHYENEKRVDKPPHHILKTGLISLLRKYREETGGRIPPSGLSFPGGQGVGWEHDTVYGKWCEKHDAEFEAALDDASA